MLMCPSKTKKSVNKFIKLRSQVPAAWSNDTLHDNVAFYWCGSVICNYHSGSSIMMYFRTQVSSNLSSILKTFVFCAMCLTCNMSYYRKVTMKCRQTLLYTPCCICITQGNSIDLVRIWSPITSDRTAFRILSEPNKNKL